MTEQEMQMWIASSLGMNVNAIPNVLLDAGDGRGWYEADLVYFRGNGYLFEVEIKTSFNDFKKDFEKSAYHTSRQVRGLYYAFPHTLWDERQQSIIELLGEKNPKAGIMLVSGRTRRAFLSSSSGPSSARTPCPSTGSSSWPSSAWDAGNGGNGNMKPASRVGGTNRRNSTRTSAGT